MQVAIMFLFGFVLSFALICGGSALVDYAIDGVAVFLGSFAVGVMAAAIYANN